MLSSLKRLQLKIVVLAAKMWRNNFATWLLKVSSFADQSPSRSFKRNGRGSVERFPPFRGLACLGIMCLFFGNHHCIIAPLKRCDSSNRSSTRKMNMAPLVFIQMRCEFGSMTLRMRDSWMHANFRVVKQSHGKARCPLLSLPGLTILQSGHG